MLGGAVCVDKAGMALSLLLAAQTKDSNLLLLTLPTQLWFDVVATLCSKDGSPSVAPGPANVATVHVQ